MDYSRRVGLILGFLPPRQAFQILVLCVRPRRNDREKGHLYRSVKINLPSVKVVILK